MRLLILATPRSATRYVAHCINRGARLDFGHEQHSRAHGGLDFQAILGHEGSFDLIWHQTRHPLHTIRSMLQSFSPVMLNTIAGELDAQTELPLVERMCAYWLKFQALAAGQASWHYRVEDFDLLWPEILERLGVAPVPIPPMGRHEWPKDKRKPLTWTDLGPWEGPMRRAAKEYGYGDDEEGRHGP